MKAAQSVDNSVDHWTMVLFYSMGLGVFLVVVLAMVLLLTVGLYAQFVWAFTHWDLMSIDSEQFRPWAQFAVTITFLLGTCIGIWLFGGYAWKNSKVGRRVPSSATLKRR